MGDMFFRRFQIQEIREGGMGTVYIARDHSVDPTHPESKFLQETGLFHTCAVKTFQDRFSTHRPSWSDLSERQRLG